MSPVAVALLLLAGATFVWHTCSYVINVGRYLGFLSSPGDEHLVNLRRITKEGKQQKKKQKKPRQREEKKADPKASHERAASPVPVSVPPRPAGTSLKSLKKQSGCGRGKQSDPAHRHSSSMFVASIPHDDEVTDVCFSSDGTVAITAARDRGIRVFKLPVPSSGSRSRHAVQLDSHLIPRGALGVCDVAGRVVVMTRGAGGEPAIASLDCDLKSAVSTCEQIFRPKSAFEPLKMVAGIDGGRCTVVAASSDPRVAVVELGPDGTLTNTSTTSYDTSSLSIHDLAIAPDGIRFALATFSADVPIFSVQRAKLVKAGSCTGAKKKVLSVAWSPCSRFLATCSEDMMLRVYDVGSGDRARQQVVASSTAAVPSGGPLTSMCWVGERLVGASGRDLFVFDGKSLEVRDAVYDAHGSSGVRLVSSGRDRFFASFASNTVRIWEL